MPVAKAVRTCESTKSKIDLFYLDSGNTNGIPILLVSGLGSSHLTFHKDFVQKLVDKNFRVIQFDNRDIGQSSNGTDNEWYFPWTISLLTPTWMSPKPPYSLEDMAKDAWALLDFLKIDRCALLGTSMGGIIISKMAFQQKKRVIAMIEVFTSTRGKKLSSPPLWVQKDLALGSSAAETLEEEAKKTAAYFEKLFVPESIHQNEKEMSVLRDFILNQCLDIKRHSRYQDGKRRQLYALLHDGTNHEEKLKQELANQTDIPVLVIHGKQDVIFAPDHGERIKEILGEKTCELMLIDGMGHYLLPKFWDVMVDKITTVVAKSTKK
jgi:pimeloyl-ACP methyl ester carboxylesterase